MIYRKLEIPDTHIPRLVSLAGCDRMRQCAQAQNLIDGIPIALLVSAAMPLAGVINLLPDLVSKGQTIDVEIILDPRDSDVKSCPASYPQSRTCMIWLLTAITMRSRLPR